MDIMDGMDTMDFPFDGQMDRFKDVTCCACPFVSMMSIASILVPVHEKNGPFPDVVKRMKTPYCIFLQKTIRKACCDVGSAYHQCNDL